MKKTEVGHILAWKTHSTKDLTPKKHPKQHFV